MPAVRDVMIVAGGGGTRLWPLTADRPDPLGGFLERPESGSLPAQDAIDPGAHVPDSEAMARFTHGRLSADRDGVRLAPDTRTDPEASLTAPVIVSAGASVGHGAPVGGA